MAASWRLIRRLNEVSAKTIDQSLDSAQFNQSSVLGLLLLFLVYSAVIQFGVFVPPAGLCSTRLDGAMVQA